MSTVTTVLLIICATVILIAGIMMWKVLDDCKQRTERRKKLRAARATSATAVFLAC